LDEVTTLGCKEAVGVSTGLIIALLEHAKLKCLSGTDGRRVEIAKTLDKLNRVHERSLIASIMPRISSKFIVPPCDPCEPWSVCVGDGRRRLAKDFEHTVACAEAWLLVAYIRLLTRRIVRAKFIPALMIPGVSVARTAAIGRLVAQFAQA
jgi:hypothetical protein